ncbi:TonB-dependent receptor [Longibacter sp.]|uniref:TonB-dependent receptor n=1 Tax=Longibacter sp. TaxID=2045415 RepID=UPI003EBFB053
MPRTVGFYGGTVRRCTTPLLALLIILCFPANTLAQTIFGRVTDAADGSALPNVSVVVRGTSMGVATDQRGEYALRLPSPGRYELVVRHLGYETVHRTVGVAYADSVRENVAMEAVVIGGEEIVVSARALAVADASRSVETLSSDEMRRVRGQTIGDALKHLPGVTMLSTGPSIDKPVIRGLHSERVVLVNHGVRQEGQQWGREHAPEIDAFAPVDVSVVKGAAGVEYGAGAIGGVLRVEPRALPDRPGVGGSIDLDAFTNNGQAAGALLLEGARTAGEGTWSWRTHGSLRAAGASRAPDYVIGNSAFREANVLLATAYHRDHWHVDVMASRFSSTLGIFSGAHVNTVEAWENVVQRERPAIDYRFTYAIDAPRQEITHDLARVRAQGEVGRGVRMTVQYGIQRNQRREFDAHSPGGGPPSAPGVELLLTTHTADIGLRSPVIDAAGGSLLVHAGVSGLNQGNENGRASYLIPNYRAISGGTYARTTWTRAPWTLDAGGRLDHQWSRSFPRDNGGTSFLDRTHPFWGGSGILSASRTVSSDWTVSIAASTAWRPPGFNELYSDGVHHGSAQYEEGMPGLRGERAWGLDATVRQDGDRTRLQVGAYATRVDDFIDLVPSGQPKVTIRGVFPLFRYQQRDALLRGVDGRFEIDIADPLTVGATASVVRGTDRQTRLPLADLPADRSTLFADVRLLHRPRGTALRSIRLRVDGHGVRRQTRFPEGVDFAPPPDGYTLLDVSLRTGWSWNGTPMSLQIGAENLLNTRYRDYLDRMRYFTDAPGRSVMLRLHIDV